MNREEGQGEIDPEFVARLNDEDQVYILDREAGHEASLDAANSKADDALEACADYNRRVAGLNNR